MLERLGRWLARHHIAGLEGRLRYAQFHKEQALEQRETVISDMRGIEAAINRIGRRLDA